MTLLEASQEIDSKIENQIAEYRREIVKTKKDIADTQERVTDARAQGDLSENAEYHAAIQDLVTLSRRFQTIAEKVDAFDAYKQQDVKTGNLVVQGSTVRMYNIQKGQEYIIKVVPAGMGMPAIGALAEDCAVCKELIGAHVGQKVVVLTATSRYDYEVQEVL